MGREYVRCTFETYISQSSPSSLRSPASVLNPIGRRVRHREESRYDFSDSKLPPPQPVSSADGVNAVVYRAATGSLGDDMHKHMTHRKSGLSSSLSLSGPNCREYHSFFEDKKGWMRDPGRRGEPNSASIRGNAYTGVKSRQIVFSASNAYYWVPSSHVLHTSSLRRPKRPGWMTEKRVDMTGVVTARR